METVEVIRNADWSTAHELPNGTRRLQSKHVSTKSSGNGNKKPRNPMTPIPPSSLRATLAKQDHDITEANPMIMVVSPTGKRRLMKLADYQAQRAA